MSATGGGSVGRQRGAAGVANPTVAVRGERAGKVELFGFSIKSHKLNIMIEYFTVKSYYNYHHEADYTALTIRNLVWKRCLERTPTRDSAGAACYATAQSVRPAGLPDRHLCCFIHRHMKLSDARSERVPTAGAE